VATALSVWQDGGAGLYRLTTDGTRAMSMQRISEIVAAMVSGVASLACFAPADSSASTLDGGRP